jgi:hypothetical protein
MVVSVCSKCALNKVSRVGRVSRATRTSRASSASRASGASRANRGSRVTSLRAGDTSPSRVGLRDLGCSRAALETPKQFGHKNIRRLSHVTRV